MSNDKDILLCNMEQLVPVYEKIKEAILLSEYEDDLKIPIASINELRNCLDHIMRAFACAQNRSYEFIEAKAHLYRAGNDAYEILVMHKLTYLHEYQKQFDKEAIKETFPKYFQFFLPLVDRSKRKLAAVRAKRPVMSDEEDTFITYENIILQLTQFIEEFHEHAPGIIEYHKAGKRKLILGKIVDYSVGGVVVGLVVFLLQKYVIGN